MNTKRTELIRKRRGRLLTVLVIDDQRPTAILDKDAVYQRHCDIQCISSWAEAQDWLDSGRVAHGADLLLVDVGWLKDPSLDRIIRVAPEAPVQPVGPLLALPFIGQRPIMACSVYSAHLNNEMLRQHPFFLLTMGLIAARTEGLSKGGFRSKHLSEIAGGADGDLDRHIEELSRCNGGSPVGALTYALSDYREKLEVAIVQQCVSLTNKEELYIRLKQIEKDETKGNPVLADDDLYLGLVGAGWRDAISLRSLFADELEWGGCRYLSAEWASKVIDWLPQNSQDAVGMALEVIREQDRETAEGGLEGPFTRPEARDVVQRLFAHRLEKYDLSEVLRYVVLFANVWAGESDQKFVRASVLDRIGDTGLGEKIELNTYNQLFGLRSKTAQGSRGAFDYLRPLSINGDITDAVWLKPGDAVSHLDNQAIEKYRAEEEFPIDATRYRVAQESKL